MIYRKLGRTDLNVGVIGLGGEWFNDKPLKIVNEIIDTAIENGVNYIDIFMPQPQTRVAIGKSLKGRREKMFIQGHICTVMKDGQYERTRDIVRVRESFEDLLEQMQTDYIDVGMIHYIDNDEDYNTVFSGDIIKYALELKEKGTIRHIGMSSHNPRIALKAVESGFIDVLMFSINAAYDLEKSETDIYSLMDYKDLADEGWEIDHSRQALYSACERLGVGITVMKALGAGSLLKAESSPFDKPMTVTQCCHYCLTRPGVTSVLIGCSSKEEILNAVSYCTATDEDKDYTHILSGNENVKISGRCMYCNHCQPCPSGIDIASVTKFLDLSKEQESLPETVKAHYFSMDKTADDCIMCGKCEPNCPFGVKVRDNMEMAKRVFSK